MPIRNHRWRQNVLLVCALIVTSSLVQAERTGTLPGQRSVNEGADPWVLAVPTRRAADAPPSAPPALPTGADRVTALTMTAIVRRQSTSGRAETLRQTISRTADRIHIAASNGREWLFERNPRDPRRVSASIIEHASHAIVLYEESDLRMMLGIRGWADVLTLGFDRDALNQYKRARQARTVGGIRFARYATDRRDASTGEVWWSEEHVFPSGFTTTDQGGSTRFSIERVRTGADATLLRPPDARFPTYRVFDLADWLERH